MSTWCTSGKSAKLAVALSLVLAVTVTTATAGPAHSSDIPDAPPVAAGGLAGQDGGRADNVPPDLAGTGARLTAGGMASPEVRFVRNIPFDTGGAMGARIVGDHLYVTNWTSFSIYDISQRRNPRLLSHTLLASSGGDPVQQVNQDVATNGRILVFTEESPRNVLHIWDVSDKRQPREIARLETPLGDPFPAANHTMACLFDCQWLWGSSGAIIDLRDPHRPIVVQRLWTEGLPGRQWHHMYEVRPGRVLTGTQPIMYLDSSDPLRPRLLATGANADNRYIHNAYWPRQGSDTLMLAITEVNYRPRCELSETKLMTWDTSRVATTGQFHMVHETALTNGIVVDGDPPVDVIGCTAHWFDTHPTFHNGGLVTMGAYEHGTQFWRIGGNGEIRRAGWFLPHGGSTAAAYWANDRIVYAIDVIRGMDVLEYVGTR